MINNKYNRIISRDSDGKSFWPTFTDCLSTVLMVVILTLFSSQSINSSVKQDVSKNITKSVEKMLKQDKLPVKVNKTGQVTIGESTMFDTDSDKLKSEAKDILKKFVPKYVETLYKNHNVNISKIIVEGHTDDVGSYMYNLDLSQRRAFSVAKYMVSDEIGNYKYKDQFMKQLMAVGRSKADLIKKSDGSINRDASRRVEIKYELKFK